MMDITNKRKEVPYDPIVFLRTLKPFRKHKYVIKPSWVKKSGRTFEDDDRQYLTSRRLSHIFVDNLLAFKIISESWGQYGETTYEISGEFDLDYNICALEKYISSQHYLAREYMINYFINAKSINRAYDIDMKVSVNGQPPLSVTKMGYSTQQTWKYSLTVTKSIRKHFPW